VSTPEDVIRVFEEGFFSGDMNRFVGSGGEVLLKADPDAPPTRMDVEDRLIGIGATHLVENLSVPPGPDAFHAMDAKSGLSAKFAERAFTVTAKEPSEQGFEFSFAPLSPDDYSRTLFQVSHGRVEIPAASIPPGTIILSHIDPAPTYTLKTLANSPGENWYAASKGVRHWNVGIGKPDDFWSASFPSDEVGALAVLLRGNTIGSIRFGLSLLDGSTTVTDLQPVTCVGPSGVETEHQFCLDGMATGTSGVDTPFPIGVLTQIRFRPVLRT
jgi:hypothetical protein